MTTSGLVLDTRTRTTAAPTTTETTEEAQTSSDPTPATTFSVSSIPTDLPFRIYPRQSYVDNKDLSGSTFVSVQMDSAYGWKFVVGNSVASSQLLTYMRMQIVTALGLTSAFSANSISFHTN